MIEITGLASIHEAVEEIRDLLYEAYGKKVEENDWKNATEAEVEQYDNIIAHLSNIQGYIECEGAVIRE